MDYLETEIFSILDNTRIHLSNLKPTDWYSKKMIMPRGSAFPGPFKYDLTPYWKEPLDCVAKDHPAKEISIMKGAQLGGTVAVLNPAVGYTIAENPGNIMFLTGHSELSEAAVIKIDYMIDNCGMRQLIRPNIMRAKNSRSGDTNKSKEFAGGDFKSGSVTNHNLLRQHDVMIMIVDDYDAAPSFSKQAGATRELVQKRTSAFAHKKKIIWCSSPQLKGSSNIEEVFLLGDQRYYNVPCPCCHEMIVLKWDIPLNDTKDRAGIYWELDSHGNLDKKSVGYICQKCGNFFNDTHKYEMNINGIWQPTAIPKEEDHWSYQISSLYAPPGMDGWAFYVGQYIAANPVGQKRHEKKHQTFLNVVLGETYEQVGEQIKEKALEHNIRNYEIILKPESPLPEKLSQADGNGNIVLLTCACDLNGKIDDARLDYEVIAYTESGSSYSLSHGSIGTFVPREGEKKNKADREKWTYEFGKKNSKGENISVWPELSKVLDQIYVTDTGRRMKIFLSGIDCGHFTQFAYTYIDNSIGQRFVVGLKGKDVDKFVRFGVDSPTFRVAKERSNLFLVEVNQVKDDLADLISLKWDEGNDEVQPPGFMNFPIPSNGLYLYKNFFSHYEAETRVTEDKDGLGVAARWVKKNTSVQNHFFDVRVYNLALKDIVVSLFCKDLKIKNYTWKDYVDVILKRR